MPLADLRRSSVILDAEFYARPAVQVARDLLGKIIVHREAAGRIVEVEAYLGEGDAAAHAAAGLTARTRVLFGPPGRAYVYLIYGIHECLNFVAEPEGSAGCVLIRALEPVCGVKLMRRRRPAARRLEDLCSGPGKLTVAMGVTRAQNGCDVTHGGFTVRALAGSRPISVATSARIGVTKSVDLPLRFYIKDSPFVSRGK
ncbi:MAG: DNA-3-methyladenine glycosylase [Acidobacteria bacterium]|nr:DNA-3-methyladenine glycosylase [Acidobacteriota bacterium]